LHRSLMALAAIVLSLGVLTSTLVAQDEPEPDGVTVLLPRGGIPAVFEPTFVTAAEADIPDDAWVLGVAIDGNAHAYSLNLLNHHEVVNDHFGDLPVAAVW
jgi:carotenoid cleavage dioxygenase-like enzyme